jgi:hypothetical protein
MKKVVALTKRQREMLDDVLREHELIKLGHGRRPYAILKENVHGRSGMKRIVWNGSHWELGPLA